MCDTAEEREESKKVFKKAQTVVEFMELWSNFYENKICIPTYFSKFIGGDDNEFATEELGQKFKEIARRGFLAVDSQVGIPGIQKGYVIGYLPEKMAHIVAVEMNRYSGIVAFYSDITENGSGEDLYVTYDALDDVINESAQQKKMLGDPYTSIGRADVQSFEQIREWMSSAVKKKFNSHKYFIAVAPCFDAAPHLIPDKLLEVLRKI